MLTYQQIRAKGHFSLDGGSLIPSSDVQIEIEQLGSGSTFLYYQEDQELGLLPLIVGTGGKAFFIGMTDDGFPIRTSNLRGYLGPIGDRSCFSLAHATCGDSTSAYTSVELALTNVIFDQDKHQRCSFAVQVDDSPLVIELVPRDEYEKLIFHMHRTNDPTVTATLRIPLDSVPLDFLDTLSNDFCAALSMVLGRKIQWIHRTAYSAPNKPVWSEMGETKTKNPTHRQLCFNPDTGAGIHLSIHDVVSIFPRVREFRQGYDAVHRILYSWLDARLQADFLEARTLKYAVVLEGLCHLVESQHDDIPSTRVPKSEWRATGKEFLPRIKSHLEGLHRINAEAAKDVCNSANWGNLNRAGFRTILAACLQKLGISMLDGAKRIRRFTDVRNKIVHSFRYLTTDDFNELNWPAITETQQHFLVACFVDEVMLRLFGLGERIPDSLIDSFKAHSAGN